MAEYVAPAAVEIVADQAKEYASPYLRYFFRYGEIVKDFKNQREALELKKERVKIRVDEAERQNELIHKDVDNWLTSAGKELKETQNLKDEIDRVKCFKWCPKRVWRYSLSKKLTEKTPIISKLLDTSNFAKVGYRRPLQGIEFITSTDFMDSEYSKSAFNQIMEAINAKDVNMIRLHGMPGVGKTTLAKEVGKHAPEQKFFDKVVMFTMSQNPDINKIQDKVADIRGLKFETKFKLEDIGIPFGDDHKGCKILLTTRQKQVCSKMKCQKEIHLGILSKEEAWVLFRDKAGLEDDCSTLNDVAKEVSAQCKGLPLAIVVVAKALKGKSLNGWRDANQRFKDSTHLYDEEVLGGVLQPLKLSYNYLKKGINQMTGNHIQMCFLLCSLFPEDEEILIEILIMCGIGVGLFPNFYSIEEKRKKIVEALKKLQKSGLLLETDGADTIRIHDVIRDFAHWLTSTGENRFMVKDTLEEWPHMDESYTAISLWNCSSIIKKFPDKVEFSKLKTLFLEGEKKRKQDDFLVVFVTFFEEMKALQVLLLQHVSFSLKGFPCLPNLKILWCFNCMLENFSSSLTNMRNLEILALISTKIDGINEELLKLSTLKYLRISEGINFPPGLVSRLTSLQELHVVPKINLNLLELRSLSRLTALSLELSYNNLHASDPIGTTLSTNQIPLEDFVLPKLQRYAIVVGEIYGINREAFRTLDIQNFSSSLSAFNNLFCNVEELCLRNVGGQKNIVPSIDEMGLNGLTSLELKSHNDIEFLIDTKKDQGSTVAFSNLVELTIESMVSLKGLWYGVSPTRFLQNLKQVIIKDCEELQTPLLSNLTKLSLCSLPKLKRIWEVNPSHRAIASLQSLKVVRIESCDNLKTIFSPCLALSMLHLQVLYISFCDRLEQVIGFGQEDEIIENDCLLYCWPKLRVLSIHDCESLKYISTNTLIQPLESIDIKDCPRLIQIFNMEKNKDGLGLQNHCWTKLKILRIVDCQRLKYVFANTLSQGFPLLKYVYLQNCPQLLQVFSSTEERNVIGDHILLNVPFLQDLEVSDCPQFSSFIAQARLIEELVLSNVGNSRQLCNTDVPILNEGCIVVGNHEVFQVQGGYSFSSIKILRLWNLFELQVIWNDFAQVVTLENLTTLTLSGCKKLRYIFSLTMAQSLSHLVDLFIEGCEEIERLILAKDQVSSSSSSNGDTGLQPISFPNLTNITIRNCGNLKSLFPFGYVPVLPKLECLKLNMNSKLEEVFELEDEVEVTAEKEMNFDKLEWLSLEELPGLIHFCPKGYHFVLSALRVLTVRDCPKLTSGFFIDSQAFVHCKTKTPQSVEQDAIRNPIFSKNINWNWRWPGSQLPHVT
ncbi:hypothetical protein [Gossypium barbadense]|uniref:NB-ARC domain-containing protein n=1 Tax=Gossypium barbadense TaxID=3634 RepID=A0A5J5NG67_GOSBA|nr:hypothetical protein [Gossypium barbadense]